MDDLTKQIKTEPEIESFTVRDKMCVERNAALNVLSPELLPSLPSGRGFSLETHSDVSAIPEPSVLRINDSQGLWRQTDSTLRYKRKRRVFICKICSSTFSTIGRLTTHHKKIHMKLFLCHHCGVKVGSSSALATHIRTHSGEKPYDCAFCEKAFVSNHRLRIHERIHTGIKPYICGNCGARFSTNHALKRHYMTHTGEKPYECTQCGARFNQAGNLRAHMKLHTGEKPYECDLCGACFAWNVCLKTHRKNCGKNRKRSQKNS